SHGAAFGGAQDWAGSACLELRSSASLRCSLMSLKPIAGAILGHMTAREEWRQAYEAASLRDVDAETTSGVPLEPVYGPEDGPYPGQWPYTRGPYASMYRSKLWTRRMFVGFGSADDYNVR